MGSDGLPVQCVGPWAEDKYYFLERYLASSREARRKFTDKGNSVFIDLFAGPGRCIIKNEHREIPSGGFRALSTLVPFNEYIYVDIESSNEVALRQRMGGHTHCAIRCGDSNRVVGDLVAQLSLHSYRYHFAFVDPFGPKALHFQTIAKLAQLRRMDMLIHFPIGAIRRSLKAWLAKQDAILDTFLGTPIWRERIQDFSLSHVAVTLLDIYKDQLRRIGYPEDRLRLLVSQDNVITGMPTVSVRNRRQVDLYFLLLISRHPLAQTIWNSVISITPSGQTTLRLTRA